MRKAHTIRHKNGGHEEHAKRGLLRENVENSVTVKNMNDLKQTTNKLGVPKVWTVKDRLCRLEHERRRYTKNNSPRGASDRTDAAGVFRENESELEPGEKNGEALGGTMWLSSLALLVSHLHKGAYFHMT